MGRKWKRNRKNKHTGQGKPRDKKPVDPSKYGQERDPYSLIVGGNFKMEAYYAYQGIHDMSLNEESGTFVACTSGEEKEAERQRWLTNLKSILPASFRIGADVDDNLRERLEKELDEYVGKKMEIEIQPKGGERLKKELNLKTEIKLIAPAKKIPYIPHAYQLSLDRQTIRRNTKLNGFHQWLQIQTEAGFISRQETVSMIPPVVLDPKPNHKILDMCAAPGSKTSQLLEIANLPANPGDTEPTGCVIANDSDSKRAYMLVHQLRRINSPAVFITTSDAQFFPLLRSKEYPTEGIFDRVLCDVPCSGDGTSRKNPGIWKRWNQLNAFGLHVLQLGIALKGARLTQVGGYLCYSTCSMNPIENEAVVAALLRASEGSLELVDRRSELPGLLARPGMSTWKVLSEDKSRRQVKNIMKKNNDKMKARRKAWEEKNGDGDDSGKAEIEDGVEANEQDEKQEEGASGKEEREETNGQDDEQKEDVATKEELPDGQEKEETNQFGERVPIHTPFEPTSMDPAELKKMVELAGLKEFSSVDEVPFNSRRRIRTTVFPPSKEEAEKFRLDLCMRVMPHDMDTGGFFVALLKKVAPMNARARQRFQTLQEELQDGTNDDQGEVTGEPEAKKMKVESEEQTKKADDNEATTSPKPTSANADAEKTGEETEKDDNGKDAIVPDEVLKHEKDSTTVVRGHVKKNFLAGNDGKKHESLGRDDFIRIPDNIFGPLKDFYGLSSDSFDEGNYMVRACGDAKVLYFITKTVKSLIDQGIQERLTVVTSGLKGFVRNNKECAVHYRVAQEGVHFVAPHMTKRKFCANVDDFRKCLSTETIKLESFSDEFRSQVEVLDMGSFVVYLDGFGDDYIKKFIVVMWRCRSPTVNCLVSKAEVDGMKSRLRSILPEGTKLEEDATPADSTAKADSTTQEAST